MHNILISVFDRSTRTYHIFSYPPEDSGVIGDLVKGQTVERLNERYELAIDGNVIGWPHTDPHLIEQFIHQYIHREFGPAPISY